MDLEIEETGKIVVDGTSLVSNVSNLHSEVMIEALVEDAEDSNDKDYKQNLRFSYDTKHNEKWEHVHNLIDTTFFPEINFTWNTKHVVSYSTAQFIDGMSKAVSAASMEEHRPDNNAVMIGFGSDGVEFFASDGRQMAYVCDSSHISDDERKALIQSQIVSKIIKKNIFDSSKDIEISISEGEGDENGKVRFRQSGLTVITNFAKDANLLPYHKILGMSGGICKFKINAGMLKDDLKVFFFL